MMRKALMTLVWMCMALGAVAQDNCVYIENFEISTDSVVTVPVMMSCNQESRGVQFNMVLPVGLALVDEELTEYSEDLGMRLSTRMHEDNNTHIVVVYPARKTCFESSKTMAVMRFSFKALKRFEGGQILFRKVRGSTAGNTSIILEDGATTVTLLPETLMTQPQEADPDGNRFFN